ncbi:MAG: ABC transporter permease [Phaeodactylibacter sp.]|nr:ABC transporter permease [Phaeodactylibacter sp.]MCB9273687.1 ABC transporter permease [Lewinellaceae bacterium]
MFRTHLKIALRNLLKDRAFSTMNLLGLAVSMAACLAILQFVRYEWNYDRNSPYAEQIWRVYCETITGDGQGTLDANTHSAIGPALYNSLPEVTDFTRLYNHNEDEVTFVRDGKPARITGTWMADPGFLRMFPQEFLSGDAASCLAEPYSLVLTESAARTLFGSTDIVGQAIRVPGGVFSGTYTVKGVVANPLPNTHLKFNALASYATWYAQGNEDNWDNYWGYTYFLTSPGAPAGPIRQKLAEFSEQHLKEGGLRLHMQRFTDIHLHSALTYEIEPNGSALTVHFLAAVAVLILLIAFFNYVNMTTARAIERAKEVGLRKVAGASRLQLAAQFLLEGALLNSTALLMALAALPPLLIWFGRFSGRPLMLFLEVDNWLAAVSLAIFAASLFISCLYPAVVLSGYRPAQVLKGRFARSSKGQPLRQGLVVFQFTCSTILIIAVIVMGRQLDFLKKHNLGLSLSQVVAVKSPELDFWRDTASYNHLSAFHHEVSRLPGVRSMALSEAVPGLGISGISGGSGGLQWSNRPEASTQASIYFLDVSPSFFETYNISFLAGGIFDVTSREAMHSNVIINESARRVLGFPDTIGAIGEPIAFERHPGRRMAVRGVVADFHIEGLKEPTRPTLYYLNPRLAKGYLSLKMEAPKAPAILERIKSKWPEVFPLSPFEFWYLDEHFEQQYAAEQKLSAIFRLFAGLAAVVAGIGLFGLAAFTAEQRTKEIGIRKVLGASTAGIVALLTKDFLKLAVLALAIASPLAWYLLEKWLQDFAYRIEIQWWMFALAGAIGVTVALLTASFQSIKAGMANPVESLKAE